MDGTTVMGLTIGGVFLLLGTMMFVSGAILVSAESGQRALSIMFGALLGVFGLMAMIWFALPRATTAAFNGILWGSIVTGAIAGSALGWKRMQR